MHTHTHTSVTASTPTRGARTVIAGLGVAALAGLGLVFGAASPALAHDELISTTLTEDANGSYSEVVLEFSNEIMNIGTEIIVQAADGSDLTDGDPVISGHQVTQPLRTPTPDGWANVAWRVVSSDGHPIEGSFAFAPGAGIGEPEESEVPDEHAHDAHDSDTDDEHAEHAEVTTLGTEASSGISRGAIAGIVIAGLLAVGLIAAVAIGASRRRRTIDTVIEQQSESGVSDSADRTTSADDGSDR